MCKSFIDWLTTCAGEPFNNLDAVLAAIDIATEPLGLHFSHRKITVSTVGLIPEIRRFCQHRGAAQLAVSLHAPTDEIRDWIAPVNRRYPLAELMACLRCVLPTWPCQIGSFPLIARKV
jgi:23S rRNA (adenine2503-C2)-methyltransferase